MSEQKIIQGDCLEVMKTFPDKSFDLVLTSPPYDEARDYNGFSWEFDGLAKEMTRTLKDTGLICWNVSAVTVNFSETLTPFKQALFLVQECGLLLTDTIIYEKLSGPPMYTNAKRYRQMHEYVFVLAKTKDYTFNVIKDVKNKHAGEKVTGTQRQKDGSLKKMREGILPDFGMRGNVWKYMVGKGHSHSNDVGNHPAVMPVKLARDLMTSFSNEGDTVCDPFMGSGTTLLAAKQLNRNAVGIEISPEYCEIARKRLEQDLLF